MKIAKRVPDAIIVVLLLGLSFVTLYPFWNSLVISFNVGADTALGGITFWPRVFTLENYQVVFKDERLIQAFVISIFRTVVGTFLSILFTSMFAYGLTKKNLIGRKLFMIMCIVTMFFSGGLIPSFILIRSLHLIDTFWVLVVPGIIVVWNLIIFRTFFQELPDGLEESAKIDGCNYIRTFFSIIVPISGPVIATLSLFTAVGLWNDWFTASIYINNPHLMPIQTLLNQIINSNAMSEQLSSAGGEASEFVRQLKGVSTKSLVMATMMVTTLPIIMVYPFLQRFFVKGVLIGSMKE
ncbi:carbohydrate ABC transporter permease [Paenibacillus glycanilyticus]|uniref:Maltose ABC transporter permease n=1 Tax=Paenibacillus glycanilyticus TaxID=126569 RepID=A0ABQ6G7S0_9BACL|nr:carbohydrate ABC transporter permease [Paenibacillus glycanilyticus]GLX66994.1 maltose ABC transporter permease [Paenibacillus glycanilyticus]